MLDVIGVVLVWFIFVKKWLRLKSLAIFYKVNQATFSLTKIVKIIFDSNLFQIENIIYSD